MLTYELERMTARQLDAVLSRKGVDLKAAMARASPIIEDVRQRGDVALRQYARRLDGFRGDSLLIPGKRLKKAVDRIPRELLTALKTSKRRIREFHSRQDIKPFEFKDETGFLGQKVVPLKRVGVYVPGGTADYLSTVLMACVPAKLAGVDEVCVCTPGRNGEITDAVLAAADLCGVREVRPIGGAHAIAAMAYGTQSVPRVQKIVGPGGAVVTAAKLLVRNDCEIDFLAGPSEVLVIADSEADPELIARDMLAQLEHDPLARAVLVSDSKKVIGETKDELEGMLKRAQRSATATQAAKEGAIFILAPDIKSAFTFSNSYAPEHLLVDIRNPRSALKRIESAGSVFLGRWSSVAFGDYCSGTNHILPTKGTASMRSALSVFDFLKIIPYQSISARGAAELSGIVKTMALAEGLPAHADAALARARRVN